MASRRASDRAARTAPAKPKRPWWLIAVGLGAALLIALATLPAQLLAGRLARLGLGATVYSGTIWSGYARGLAWRSVQLGDLRWSFAPLDLLRGRVGGNLQLTRPDGSASTNFSVSFAGVA